jgi:putative FmdB family regulatory protein
VPLYEYQCKGCQVAFEILSKVSAPPPPCPECAGEVRKLVSESSFSLKGEGWAQDGYTYSRKE